MLAAKGRVLCHKAPISSLGGGLRESGGKAILSRRRFILIAAHAEAIGGNTELAAKANRVLPPHERGLPPNAPLTRLRRLATHGVANDVPPVGTAYKPRKRGSTHDEPTHR